MKRIPLLDAVVFLSALMVCSLFGCAANLPPKVKGGNAKDAGKEKRDDKGKDDGTEKGEPKEKDPPKTKEDGKDKAGTKEKKTITPVPKPPSESDKFVMLKVFYGTDRAPLTQPTPANISILAQFGPGGLLLGAAVFAGFMHWRRPGTWLRQVALALTLMGGTFLFAAFYFGSWLHPTFAKRPIVYGADRGELQYGICEVSIPKSHKTGLVEAPSILRLEFKEDPVKHIMLQKVEQLAPDAFFQEARSVLAKSRKEEAFVFVHGYNVGFEDAARRTAQMAYDLKFDGVPIFYSWPSQGGFLSYAVDETNVEWTIPHLKKFLSDVSQKTGAKTVHLIAHSMGNRALTRTLKELHDEKSDARFNEVILAAPDIDADVFRNQIQPAIVNVADRVTLYASANDYALQVSQKVHGYRRAGDAGKNILVLPKMDTIDVTSIDTSFLGHSYYGDNNSVITDLKTLIDERLPPHQRKFLSRKEIGYWVFMP